MSSRVLQERTNVGPVFNPFAPPPSKPKTPVTKKDERHTRRQSWVFPKLTFFPSVKVGAACFYMRLCRRT